MIYWNMLRSSQPITLDMMPDLLIRLGPPWGPSVELTVLPRDDGARGRDRPEHRVRICWANESYEFVVEYRARSTPKAIDDAVLNARRSSDMTGLPAMIIVPYLNERRLDELAAESISAVDLSGNGVVIVPGQLFLRTTGQPNRYPDSQPTKYAYRGATSLVPRVFLCQPQFESVSAIKDSIEARGGSVALSTVSKALARMTEDVLIDRTDSRITLIQPDALLDKLRESFQPPVARTSIRVRVEGSVPALFRRANQEQQRPRLVLSGSAAQSWYAAGMRSDERTAYCERIDDLRTRLQDLWEETERFADLTVVETKERTPFFDSRTDEEGITYASPVQAFLELSVGDKRDQEMAGAIRTAILRELEGRFDAR